MAGRKPRKNGFDPNNPTQADIDYKNQEDQMMQIQANDLAQIAAVENQTKELEQEVQNKQHDDEMSPSNEGNSFNGGNLNVIGAEQIQEATAILTKYAETRADLQRRFIDNEKIWKMQHWDVLEEQATKKGANADQRIKPKSSWLVNTILNKHADAMDNFPEANILPRARDDEETAKQLSQIIPVILEQNEFEKTYSDCQWYKMKNGTCCYGAFWNNDKNNGLGDIEITKMDINAMYWKSGVTDIQDSPNVFIVKKMADEEIKARWSNVENVGSNLPLSDSDGFHYGEAIDDTGMSDVVDWYYKRRIKTFDENGLPKVRTVLHYCKFTSGVVLYASENDPNYAERGYYDHGRYPFVFDQLFPVEKNICGMGYIDLIADDQMFTDKLKQAILENACTAGRPRYLVRGDGGVNEEELLDTSKPVVHTEGSLDDSAFKQIVPSPMPSIVETVYLQQIQEMKDTSGNTATSQGQTSSVTTASGIASLMEASGKLSRDSTSESYRAYKQVVYLVIELIRQFYTYQRCFRITNEDGKTEFVDFDNSALQEVSQGAIATPDGGVIDFGSRLPIMDIEVKAQKKSAYSKETQNQTALQLYGMGFFAPQNADAALTCLNMMDFDGVDKMREAVGQNGTLMSMLMQAQAQIAQLSAIVAKDHPEVAGALMQQGQSQELLPSVEAGINGGSAPSQASKGSLPSQAANNTRESTAPRT